LSDYFGSDLLVLGFTGVASLLVFQSRNHQRYGTELALCGEDDSIGISVVKVAEHNTSESKI
jgi:hypothetical protein